MLYKRSDAAVVSQFSLIYTRICVDTRTSLSFILIVANKQGAITSATPATRCLNATLPLDYL